MAKELLKFRDAVKAAIAKTKYNKNRCDVGISVEDGDPIYYRICIWKLGEDFRTEFALRDASAERVIKRLLFEIEMIETK